MFPIVIESIDQAFKILKLFGDGEWEGDYRVLARRALKEILEERMGNAVDVHLERMRARDMADRRNGSYSRHLLTELGDLELSVPRSRRFSPVGILKKFSRRAYPVERLIMLSFILGLSTRKVGQALLPILGEKVSPSTVSRISKELDSSVLDYHRRVLSDHYQVLILDGLVIKRKTGVGPKRRTVLVALGIRWDGRKEIIDFRQVSSEKEVHWEAFLNDLYKRGLQGRNLKLIIGDGAKGLLAALPFVYGDIAFQRCWAHKTRNCLNYVKRAHQKELKKDLNRISHAPNLRLAQKEAKCFVERWEGLYPKATHCLKVDLEDLLTFLQVNVPLPHSALRTTNAIERRFREVRRRTRPMGVFSNRTSVERIIFSVFTYENLKEKTNTPFPIMTQNK